MKEIWTAALKIQSFFFLEAEAELTFDAILHRESRWPVISSGKLNCGEYNIRPTFTSLISVNPHGTIIVQDEPPKNVQSIRHQCHPVSRGNFNVSIFRG